MQFAIRLPNTGGYPMTPHRVFDPVPGSVRALLVNALPGQLIPIEDRNITLEQARLMHDDPGCPLELVQIDKNGKEIHHKVGADGPAEDTQNGKD